MIKTLNDILITIGLPTNQNIVQNFLIWSKTDLTDQIETLIMKSTTCTKTKVTLPVVFSLWLEIMEIIEV